MKILVKLFAIVPPLWPIWFLAEWWTFSKRPYPCFVDSRNPRFLQIFKTNAFTQLALKRFSAATYHPRVHKSTRSCSWCFLRRFCQSMSASHRWFSAKIRKPLLHWHFALWRPPTKCLLAENEEIANNFNYFFAAKSIRLVYHLLWYERSWCVRYSLLANEPAVLHGWHLRETHRLHSGQCRLDTRAISTPHLCDCTQRGRQSFSVRFGVVLFPKSDLFHLSVTAIHETIETKCKLVTPNILSTNMKQYNWIVKMPYRLGAAATTTNFWAKNTHSLLWNW